MPVENSRANDEAELHVSLDRPPQAHSLTVRALLQRVQGGGSAYLSSNGRFGGVLQTLSSYSIVFVEVTLPVLCYSGADPQRPMNITH